MSKVLLLFFFQMTKVPLRGQKSVRNQSETCQKPVRNRPTATSLSVSLPCLFPHPPTRTLTPTPIPISTTTTAAAGTTVSFPDRFRTAQACFAPKFETECVHAWILTLITRVVTTLSTTTTPAATSPPLPLVHLGISCQKLSNPINTSPAEGSETSQKPIRNRPNATIISVSPLRLSLPFLFPRLLLSVSFLSQRWLPKIFCLHLLSLFDRGLPWLHDICASLVLYKGVADQMSRRRLTSWPHA